MIRHRLVAIALGAVALTACGSVRTTDLAASVADDELSFDTVDEVLGEASGDADATRAVVGRFAIDASLRADLAALGVDSEATDVAEAGREGLDASINERVVQWQSIPVDQLADDDTRDRYETGAAPIACLAHILTETRAEADDALARIESGEPFEAVAVTASIDTQSGINGGTLGCVPEGQIAATYVPGFAEAAESVGVGEVAGPAESQFGFHLVTRVPFDQLDQTGLLQVRLSLFEDRYDIFIEPRVGQWSGFGEILPLG